MDLKQYEKKYRFKDYDNKLKVANDEGYINIIEHIIELYKKLNSMNMVADKIGISFSSVKNILNNLPKELKDKYDLVIRSKGGRSWSLLNDFDVRYIRSHTFMNKFKFHKLAEELTKSKSKELGIEININVNDVIRCYQKKTHKDVV